jgi:hypothetical protein
MSLRECKECGEAISSSVNKCPKCGKDQRNWFLKHKFISLILVIFVFIVISSMTKNDSAQISNSGAGDQVNVKVSEEVDNQEEATLVVETSDFIEEFDSNQLSAEKKYKGKRLQLTARISNISEDIMGTPFLSLEPSSAEDYYMGTTIKCSFKNEDALMAVSNQQVVTVEGMAQEQSLGIISLNDCQILE